jgi:hypothetical protein
MGDMKSFAGEIRGGTPRSRVEAAGWPAILLGSVLCAGSLSLLGMRFAHGIWFLGFPDESVHLLGGWALDSGYVLYRDFVDFHGPLIFLLTSAWGALFGWSDPNYARVIPVIFAMLSGVCVAVFPPYHNRTERLCAVALYYGLAAVLWIYQGLYMVSFYPVAGALAAMLVACFAFPLWFPAGGTRTGAALGGGVAVLLAFASYSFAPSAVLIALSGIMAAWRQGRRRLLLWFVAGVCAAGAVCAAWFAWFGDLRGYLAFHVILSLIYYRPYTPFGFSDFVRSFDPLQFFAPPLHGLVVVLFWGAALLVFASMPGKARRVWPIVERLLCLAGIALLNAVGEISFKDGAFALAAVGLAALAFPAALARIARPNGGRLAWILPGACAAVLCGSEWTMHHRTTTPGNMTYAQVGALPPVGIDHIDLGAEAALIRTIIQPGETFLALMYRPEMYFSAGRLPIPGYYTWSPLEADYARNPWFGMPHDICTALATRPPKVIAFDNRPTWEIYKPADYAPCISATLATHYRALPGFPDLYLRSDIEPPTHGN